ncbi:MAG: YncE family protein [Actinomycetota bacterium]
MRTRWLLPILLSALPACGGLSNDAGIRALAGQDLLLGSSDGVLSLDAGTGAVTFQGQGVPALGSWSSLYTTVVSRSSTMLEAHDSLSGELVSRLEVPGEMSVRVASPNGGLVALMPPLGRDASPWIPEPRATTSLVIADPSGELEPRTYELRGNFEPEAFSSDGSGLYMVSYVPATAPEAYRVARLDLDSGKVREVSTGIKGVVETMSGTRLEQVAEPDGSMLHTLYTTSPASYVEHAHQQAGTTVSFVHMLSLDRHWAHCLALPKPMWGGDPADQTMALSPDGELLYVVDSAQGLITEVDTNSPETLRTNEAYLGFGGQAPTQATVSPDGTLFVSTGTRIVGIDTATLQRSGGWTMDDVVLGLGSDGRRIFVALPGRIEVLDRSSNGPLGTIASPAVDEVSYIGLSGD